MKRFLSMLLALALVLTTLMIPVAAEDGAGEATPETPVVETVAADITSIANGDTFAAGANIVLAVEVTGLENVAHIDFYANGDKLPGTIAGNKGAIVWYDATEGAYTISTKVTDTDGNVKDGDETVKIIVAPDESKVKLLWPNGESYTGKHGEGTFTLSDEYAMFGNQSLEMIPKGNYPGITFNWADKMISRTWQNLVFVIYSPDKYEGLKIRRNGYPSTDETMDESTLATGQKMQNNTNFRYVMTEDAGADLTVHQGYNFYVTEHAGYRNKSDLNGDGVIADDEYDNNTIKYLDFMRLTMTGAGENTEEKPVYLVGIYGVIAGTNDALDAPKATPEIAEGATVSKNIGTYRINFDTPIAPDDAKVPADVTDANGNAVTLEGYKYGTDHVDLYLPELEDGKTYNVTISANTIMPYYTNAKKVATREYVAQEKFTFTTAADAKPVIAMSYPADGATVAENTAFAAKVVAKGAADIASVKLYKGEETEPIAEGTEMTDGEYWFTPAAAALTAGSATTLTVKALDANGNEVTASATYTGATAPSYAVKGIYDGATFIMQHKAESEDVASRTVTVVDSANAALLSNAATAVSKVAFYDKDNNLLGSDGTAPYEHELKFDQAKTDVLKVKVYDIYGGVHDEFVYNYTVADAVLNPASFTENFDSIAADASQETLQKSVAAAESTNITAALVSGGLQAKSTSGWKVFTARSTAPDTGHKVHYYQFKHLGGGHGNQIRVNGTTVVECYNSPITGETDKSYMTKNNPVLDVIVDYNPTTPVATVLWNGEVWKQVPVTKGADAVKLGFYVGTGYAYTMDDFSYYVYDVRPEYAVKGIYEGATIVKTEEETRTITVVDKANAEIASNEATAVEKVELLRDGKVVAESTTNACALPNNLTGEFELEVKVTDIYGDAHSFKYNYRVVDGTKSSDSVALQTFDSATDAAAALALIADENTGLTPTIAEFESGNPALRLEAGTSNGFLKFKGTSPTAGRGVHYYAFDIITGGTWAKRVFWNSSAYNKNDGQEIFHNQYRYGDGVQNKNETDVKASMKIVLDYNATNPIATVYMNDSQLDIITLDAAATISDTMLNLYIQKDHSLYAYIDNFSYSAYDAPARFGMSAAPTYEIDSTPSNHHKVKFTTTFTNTTNDAVAVRYFIAAYEEDGRMSHLYKPNHGGFEKYGCDPEGLVAWYDAGEINKTVEYGLNVAKDTGMEDENGEAIVSAYAKLFGFVFNPDTEAIDFTPIGWY